MREIQLSFKRYWRARNIQLVATVAAMLRGNEAWSGRFNNKAGRYVVITSHAVRRRELEIDTVYWPRPPMGMVGGVAAWDRLSELTNLLVEFLVILWRTIVAVRPEIPWFGNCCVKSEPRVFTFKRTFGTLAVVKVGLGRIWCFMTSRRDRRAATVKRSGAG